RTRVVSLYFELGKLPQAASLLAAALKKNPKDTDALLQESELNLRQGKASEAQNDLQKLLHLTPNSAQAHFVLSEVQKLQGKTLSARQELSEALRLDPNLLGARLELSRSNLASDPKYALQVMDETPKQQKQILAVIVARNWA